MRDQMRDQIRADAAAFALSARFHAPWCKR